MFYLLKGKKKSVKAVITIKKFDYKLIDDSTIRAVYLNILNKHSGETYVTIAHSTFSHQITVLIITDLMKSLKLTDVQARWLLNAHTVNTNSLKRSLLALDLSVTNINHYDTLGYAYKIKKEAKLGYLILGSITVIVILLLGLMRYRMIEQDHILAMYVLLPIAILAMIGCVFVFLYYRIAYHIKPDEKDIISDVTIEVQNIKLLEYLSYLPRRGNPSFVSVFAFKIVYQENNRKQVLIYPLLERQNIITSHPYRVYNRKYKSVIQRLKSIHHLKVSFNPKTRLITACDKQLEDLIFKK